MSTSRRGWSSLQYIGDAVISLIAYSPLLQSSAFIWRVPCISYSPMSQVHSRYEWLWYCVLLWYSCGWSIHHVYDNPLDLLQPLSHYRREWACGCCRNTFSSYFYFYIFIFISFWLISGECWEPLTTSPPTFCTADPDREIDGMEKAVKRRGPAGWDKAQT